MSIPATRLQEQNETAQLAAHFNEFYLETTSPSISQVGNYRIIREIGQGAFGKVYLAEHILLLSQVVLKCGLLEDPNIVREIYYHKQLRHRNIVKLYEVIKTETQLWMVLEYCEGNELYDHIYEKRRLDVISCKNIFSQIVEAMRYVHSLNLSHRDLKLENILMADEEKTVVKLTDFGFVREFNPYKRSFLSTVCGTTSYMAPEVLKNEKYSGFSIDVWSMGVILYAMVYGQLPFDEDDEMRTKLKIVNEEPLYSDSFPADVNHLLRRMLSKDPAERPSISEILNSPFLIDVTNLKTQRRTSTLTDTDSFVSINQYYNVHSSPFQSRMEKDLLKKLRKGHIDIESLINSKLRGQANALTAFYDLSLKSEFEKHRRRSARQKRYYEAKRQIQRSKKRVKSVLSLSDQNFDGQPLEKILTSLSIASNKNDAPVSMRRKSSENALRSPAQSRIGSLHQKSVGNTDAPDINGKSVQTPLERSVSFFTDDRRSSNVSFQSESMQKPKSKQLLEKLQFWKKGKQKNGESNILEASSSASQSTSGQVSEKSDNGLLEINISAGPRPPEIVPSQSSNDHEIHSEEKHSINMDDSSLAVHPTSQDRHPEDPHLSKRPRPESVISQYSQYSQASQLYTESELELMDGTDLEDDFYDDDGAYDSSMSASQNDLTHRPVSYSSSSRSKRRPPHLRTLSDNSIMSSSTSTTRRKNPLSQVSSNSSDDSSAILRLSERLDEGTSSLGVNPRPNSPRHDYGRHSSIKPRRSSSFTKHNSSAGSMMYPLPISPQSGEGCMTRPISPPLGDRISPKFNNITGKVRPTAAAPESGSVNGKAASPLSKNFLKMPTADSHTWRRDSPITAPGVNVFERKFISINEEEEEEEDSKE